MSISAIDKRKKLAELLSKEKSLKNSQSDSINVRWMISRKFLLTKKIAMNHSH
jgi:hypothetical protein